jgi:SAM-dependent methyltransferase
VASDPLDDVVSHQYERWLYPAPIEDLPGWLERNWQWFDPSHAHRLLWPDRDYPEGLSILVAGCGTNQGAVLAYTNPSARVVALDVSAAALDHHRRLAERYDLAHLELHRLPIEHADTLGQDFDLVIATGVLHHLDDPAAGMRALAGLLRPEGVLAVMLYAHYGRIGVHLLQSIFTDLGLPQDESSLDIVRDAMARVGPHHPLAGYLRIAPDLAYDAGLVDTFLHGREAAFTIDECRALVAQAGLVFQDVFFKATYYPPVETQSPFLAMVATLPREEQWSIMQRINTTNACHYFTACRPERSPETYTIDFASEAALDYIPALRIGTRVHGLAILRDDWHLTLSPLQGDLLGRVDGRLTISEIVHAVASSGHFDQFAGAEIAQTALTTMQTMWQRDLIAMGINGDAR